MNRPLRVLHVVPNLFGDFPGGIYGGAERYVYELARAMAAVTPTTLLGFADTDTTTTTPEGLIVRSIGPAWYVRGQRFNPIHPRLIRAVAAADVIHCHQTQLLVHSLTALLGRITRKPVFTSNLGGGGWDISAYIPTDSWFTGHLHISEYSRINAGHTGNPATSVILGGVDTVKFSPRKEPREPLIVFVGRLLPHKGIGDLINALPEGLTLELIGRPYQTKYQEDLKRLAVGKRVVFRENCDDDAIVAAYRRALCVVLPSVYRDCYGKETRVPELLGQTPLEGMACGTPAIVTDVASLPEVVVDGVTGFVVPPNDPPALRAKLEWLRDHPVDAANMGVAARNHVLNQFTWPSVVSCCLTAYRSARSRKSSPGASA